MRLAQNLIFIGLAIILVACSDSPQQADPDFRPKSRVAHFSSEHGPIVSIDEAHNNFLTKDGRYKPFAQVLKSDGFRVSSNTKKISEKQLKNVDILVIANALDRYREDWLPPFGEALNQNEVEVLKSWILQGGSLFLVADHTPFPKVINNLTLALGFQFINGHVGNITFSRLNHSLSEHVTTYKSESTQEEQPVFLQSFGQVSSDIQQVRSFGGSAFKAPENAVSLLNLGPGVSATAPEIPFQVEPDTPRVSMKGWSQGAVLKLGKGRVAVFSEGMMFSSQLITSTGKKLGLRSVGAEQNEEFLLNIMRWLADRKNEV
ncbi:DUF4350 domain-containing protein [Alteromonas lipotrueiana]|uniref:DUF4350 domain-containing protein n=1 Tax=Alteromonas lipotrueiana TaxID=2803815 RepID=UPI001C437501|nr:DUF4350 domain-containing protein [Alteromonas lipotrueiana]